MTWLALPLAFGLILLGCFGAVDPRRASWAFGITSESPWVRAAGVRDIAIGLIVLMVFMSGRVHVLGEVVACLTVIPVSDALLAFGAGSRKQAAAHALSAVGCLAYGLFLVLSH